MLIYYLLVLLNFFFLDRNVKKCARYHGDKHINKMQTEYAQICSMVWHMLVPNHDLNEFIYKPNHKNHPIVLWASQSVAHYRAIVQLGLALGDEKRNRIQNMTNLPKEQQRKWKPIHKSQEVLEILRDYEPPLFCFEKEDTWTDPPKCMPDCYKVDNDPVVCYRMFYAGHKIDIAGLKWKPYAEEPMFLNIYRKRVLEMKSIQESIQQEKQKRQKKK